MVEFLATELFCTRTLMAIWHTRWKLRLVLESRAFNTKKINVFAHCMVVFRHGPLVGGWSSARWHDHPLGDCWGTCIRSVTESLTKWPNHLLGDMLIGKITPSKIFNNPILFSYFPKLPIHTLMVSKFSYSIMW